MTTKETGRTLSLLVAILAMQVVSAEQVLPAGYTRLEYIESSGKQYIDTQYCPKGTDRFECEINVASPRASDYPCVFGWRNNSSKLAFIVDHKSLPTTLTDYVVNGRDATAVDGDVFLLWERMHLVCHKSVASWYRVGGGCEGSTTHSQTTFSDIPNSIWIFAIHDMYDNWNKENSPIAMKLYSFSIFSDGSTSPVCDFVPCADPNGEIGLYDVVRARFFGKESHSVGDFKPGPAVDTGVPPGYARLAYIESTDGQYINTGYCPKACDRVEFDVDAATRQKADYPCAFGYNNDVSDKRWWSFMVYHKGYERKACYNYGKSESGAVTGASFTRGCVMRVTCWTNEASYVRTDGGLAGAIRLSQGLYTDAPIPMYLFGANYKNQFCQNAAQMRLYSFKVYSQDGILRRNYVPCRNPDGEVGVYDSVMNQFLGNAKEGTVAFAVPPAAGELPAGYTRLKSIETTSARDAYVDVGYQMLADDRLDFVVVARAGGDYPNVYGWRDGSHWVGFTPQHKNTGKAEYYYGVLGREGGANTGNAFTIDKKMRLVAQTNTVWYSGVDGTMSGAIAITASEMCETAPLSLYLFAMNQNGTSAYNPCVATLFSFKVFDANDLQTPKRDYVPCMDQDGGIGVYDLVENHFYAGVGTFKAHADVGFILIFR